ncbi:MAG: glycosyltransferase [Flavobacteriales bacterium]|nr:glycosyltransferase [Flavobacteriales bacterium]MCW8912973.1 glycosyltransferase [Flavobacteriales bacterium]MCW8938775.1 glycosyltransferase [Flavobacteriales bacterium]MCW8939696.1 glycosyltransferase [Flavobacteriales bacterium]MCW8969184.1 glycosyltransferase [Flavobacteriales bacterium]
MKQKIKILRIINRFNLGGPTFNAAYLTKYIGDEFETLLIGGEKDETEASSTFILDSLGLTPTIIPEMKREIGFKEDKIAYKKLKDIIKEFQPDIVHTHASKAGTLGRMAAYKCKVPVIVHTFHGHVFHSYFGKTKTVFYKNIERYLAKKSTKIIAISDIQKNELTQQHKICKKNKVAVVPLGFDLSRFQEGYESKRNDFRKHYLLEEDEIAIGIIGRLVPIKNHTLFLESINQILKKTTKKVRVFIIGDGEEKENLTQYCKELKLDFTEFNKQKKKATITFTSWVKNVDWANAGLDIIALSSLNEGTPVSLIEAQAANNPIVTTNVGGVENVVLKDKTGFIVSSGNVGFFAEALLKLVDNNILRKEMGEKGWEFVKEKFHYERLVNDMRQLYFSLLENNKK